MTFLAVLIAALVCALPAHAGFLAPVVGWFAAGGVVAGAVANIGIGLGLSLVGRAMAPKQKKSGPGAISLDAPTSGDGTPQTIILGRRAVVGHRTCPEYSRATGNDWLTIVRDLSDAPVHKLRAIWIGNDRIEMPETFPAWTDPGVFHEPTGKYAGKLRIRFHDGTQTEADNFLIWAYGNHPDRPWRSDMALRGVAYAIIELRRDQELYPGVPDLLFEVDGLPLLDPRTGQRAWSDNLPLLAYNVMRGITLPDGSIYGGGVPASDLPLSSWAPAISEAQTQGWRGGLEVNIGPEDYDGDAPYEIVEHLLQGCAGQIAESGGTWRVRIGGPGLPVATITDRDTIVTEDQVFTPHSGPREIYNGVTAQYSEPGERWEGKTTPLLLDDGYAARDGGRNVVHLTYNAVTDSEQVQQLITMALHDNRRQRSHELSLPPDYAPVEVLDTLSLHLPYDGYVGKLVEVVAVHRDPVSMTQRAHVREVDSSDFTPPTVAPLPVQPVVTTPLAPLALPGWSVEVFAIRDNQDRDRRPAVRITWDPLPAEGIEWQMRVAGDTTIAAQDTTQAVGAGQLVIDKGLIPGARMQIRARAIIRVRPAAWTAWTTFEVPKIGLGEDDIGQQVWDEFTDLATKAGIETVTEFPAKPRADQIVLKMPEKRLYRWDGTAWVEDIFAGIPDGAIDATKIAQGLALIENVEGDTLPTIRTATTITFKGRLYSWDGTRYSADVPAVNVTGQLTNDQIAAVAAAKLTGQIGSVQIADRAVSTGKIADAAIEAGKLAKGAVTGDKIADAALSLSKFADGLRPIERVTSLPGTPHVLGRVVSLTTEGGKLYRNTGSGWTASVPAADVSGQLGNDQIAAVAAAKLTGQITGTQITDRAISTGKMAAGSVSTAILAAGSVVTDTLAAWAVTAGKLAAASVTALALAANSVTAGAIAANAIEAGHIRAGAISTDALAANAVTASKLVITDFTNLVTNGIFAGGSSDGWNLASGVSVLPSPSNVPSEFALRIDTMDGGLNTWTKRIPVAPGDEVFGSLRARASGSSDRLMTVRMRLVFEDGSGNQLEANHLFTQTTQSTSPVVFTGSVMAPPGAAAFYVTVQRISNDAQRYYGYLDSVTVRWKTQGELIVDGAITAAKLMANAVTAAAIAAGTITSAEIASGAITTAKLDALAVTTAKITASAITGDKIAANAITAREIQSASISTALLAAGAVVAEKIATDAVTTRALAANSVSANALAANSVTAGAIAANAITAAKIAAGAVGAEQIAAKAIATSKLAVSNLENLFDGADALATSPFLPTSGANGGRGDWSSASGQTGYRGQAALMIAGEWSGVAYEMPSFPVTPGAEYFIRFYGARDSSWDGQSANSKLRIGDQSGGFLASISYAAGDLPHFTTSNWAERSAVFRVPDGVNALNITLGNDATAGRAYLAGFEMRLRNSGELIVDGAITAAKVMAGAITANAIAASAILASHLAAGSVTANALAANSVTARAIAARSVTADAMAANSVTAQNGAIGNLAVQTLNIAGNAVTVPVAAFREQNTGVDSSNNETTVLNATMRNEGYPVSITLNFSYSFVRAAGASIQGSAYINLYKNGSLLRRVYFVLSADTNQFGLASFNYVDTDVSPGTDVYSFRSQVNGFSNAFIANTYLGLSQVKK
ncbi:phage tail protein [Falsirhodobacter halotolerans]|uniref:phage tail protein n=1 Tax=Falsirhodobacter halotolerans TaxID=1146892 RepID=UPI001FD0FDFE|nr:phage tail protein [Falsirhodobacter halotolerans]MCJ8138440.1 phage tail protein [Falsirhodobacter halotolerans]